jgi:dihydrofolate reductase
MPANVNLIWAQDLSGGIGYDNELLFNIPEDLKFFSQTTRNSTIVMGRKTWDSLPKKPLPSRRNIVLSRTVKHLEGAEVYPSLAEALQNIDGDLWVIGGESLYNEAIHLATTLYVTQIFEKAPNIDAYAPKQYIVAQQFERVNATKRLISEKTGIEYEFVHYARREN